MDSNIFNRKNEHIQFALKEQNDLSKLNLSGFDEYIFEHQAAPELNFKDINTECTLFGKKLNAPIIIGAMTGGTDTALEINRKLAIAAETKGIAMAVGSQRAMINDKNVARTFQVKAFAPNLPLLIGNIGAVQLNYGVNASQIEFLINEIQADALYFHLNPLQEVLQPEGDTDFSNLLSKINYVINELKSKKISKSFIIKEIGSGISVSMAQKLSALMIDAVEVAGVGGTSWAKIEGDRNQSNLMKSISDTFSDWGISTAQSILNAKSQLNERTIISSGGIRNGIDIAKSIALGASAVSIARPFIVSSQNSIESITERIDQYVLELKISMFLIGAKNINELQNKKALFKKQ